MAALAQNGVFLRADQLNPVSKNLHIIRESVFHFLAGGTD